IGETGKIGPCTSHLYVHSEFCKAHHLNIAAPVPGRPGQAPIIGKAASQHRRLWRRINIE
ncbi:MAG: hypothetical protein D6694_15280, partial [Gammaproteobacteria bacterium]